MEYSMHGPIVPNQSTAAPTERLTGFAWTIAMVAALGGLLFGYDWVVIGGAREFYEKYFHLTSAAAVGWANSCALLGCLVGSLVAGYLAERFGRRRILLAAAILFALSSALTGWAFSFTSFIFWRIIGGVAIGLCSNISPLYIAEMSPPAFRGRLVSLNQFAIVIGILLAQVANWIIAMPEASVSSATAVVPSWNVLYGWRWMFTVLTIPSAVFLIASLYIPESPRWLLARNRRSEAQETLRRVGGVSYAEQEIASILRALESEEEHSASSIREFIAPGVRGVLLVGIALAVLQQWTGVNILFNYAAEVYRNAGYGSNDIFLNIVVTGAINLVFTILAMSLVDRLGRRFLMLLGCVGIGASHFLCALAYHQGWHGAPVLILTLSAIGCYALTLAPVTWVLIAEIFPGHIRSQAVSVAVSALWIASFALTYTFPFFNQHLGAAGTFCTYGLICLLGWVLVFTSVRETKGKSLEEIESGVTEQ
jgi:SP family xylose:H+ symportor-like MFS transporter